MMPKAKELASQFPNEQENPVSVRLAGTPWTQGTRPDLEPLPWSRLSPATTPDLPLGLHSHISDS